MDTNSKQDNQDNQDKDLIPKLNETTFTSMDLNYELSKFHSKPKQEKMFFVLDVRNIGITKMNVTIMFLLAF